MELHQFQPKATSDDHGMASTTNMSSGQKFKGVASFEKISIPNSGGSSPRRAIRMENDVAKSQANLGEAMRQLPEKGNRVLGSGNNLLHEKA